MMSHHHDVHKNVPLIDDQEHSPVINNDDAAQINDLTLMHLLQQDRFLVFVA